MHNELIKQKSWWKQHWKWFIPLSGIGLILIVLFLSFGFSGILGDLSKAYADPKLYEIPMQKVQQNERVKEVLGIIKPINNMTILNGSVQYSEDNTSVNSTIKITGEKGKAMLDISANRSNDTWIYKKINVRIKNPPEKKELIEIIKSVSTIDNSF